MDQVEFRTGRWGHFFVGLGLLGLAAAVVYLSFSSEEEFLGTRTRRGGIFKLIEQAIGWELFVVLMLLFGAWALIYATVSFWKVLDSTPDVLATHDQVRFHPAVKSTPVAYREIDRWSLEYVSGHPVVRIYLSNSYWSLQGMFKRRSVKLEGSEEDLRPLIDFFALHPEMRDRFVPE